MSDIPRPASRSTIRRTDVAAIVLLAVLVLLFLWRVTLLGKVLLPLDALFPMEPWKSETTHPADAVWNPIVTDAVWQWAPLASAARELQRSGSYLWDPLSMGGMPSFVAGSISVNPLVFTLGHFLSVAAAMSWAAVISLVLSATFTYLLLRELDCAPQASLIGALAFTFNGYLVGWLSLPNMTGGMIWLPAIAWGIERSINARNWRWSLVSACAFALQLLTSSILFSFYGAVTIGILLACRCIAAVIRERNVAQALRPLRYGALTFAVGAGIAAIPLFTHAATLLPDRSYGARRRAQRARVQQALRSAPGTDAVRQFSARECVRVVFQLRRDESVFRCASGVLHPRRAVLSPPRADVAALRPRCRGPAGGLRHCAISPRHGAGLSGVPQRISRPHFLRRRVLLVAARGTGGRLVGANTALAAC